LKDPLKTRVVVTDTCILINLIHVDRLTMLGTLPGYAFIIPDHVYEEVIDPEQRRMLDRVLAQGGIDKEPLVDMDAIKLYATLRRSFNRSV